MKKILVYGAGYVGLANALLLAKKNDVTVFDVNEEIINKLSRKEIHIDDDSSLQQLKKVNLKFELKHPVEKEFDYIILALPTNYDAELNKFNTKYLDEQLEELNNLGVKATIIIKSTIPMGYTQKVKENYLNMKIVFSPEFLREGSSFSDAEAPDRIVIGNKNRKDIVELFQEVSVGDPEVLETSSTEAEAIKLFANTYLAMRVSFVNELDTFAKMNDLNTDDIIKGVSLDKRIGQHYFSPSFGYGGYCLPKDSKQLRYEFNDKKVPSKLFDAIVESNEVRKEFVVSQIIESGVTEYTIEGIGHKPGVSNFRNSPKLEVAEMLRARGIKVTIVDKNFKGQTINGFEIA